MFVAGVARNKWSPITDRTRDATTALTSEQKSEQRADSCSEGECDFLFLLYFESSTVTMRCRESMRILEVVVEIGLL